MERFHNYNEQLLSFRELRGWVKTGEVLLLDERPEREYRAGHFPGAMPLPIKDLEEKFNPLP